MNFLLRFFRKSQLTKAKPVSPARAAVTKRQGMDVRAHSEPVARAAASLNRERVGQMFERASSFSFIAIPGHASADISALLKECKYSERRRANFHGPFAELCARLGSPSGPNNAIVCKAWYPACGFTILVDPEMVLNTQVEQLSRVAESAGSSVFAAIWERVSETVMLKEIGPSGIVRQSWYCEGQPTDKQKNPHSQIGAQPNSEGLRFALEEYGLRNDVVFGTVQATVVELQE